MGYDAYVPCNCYAKGKTSEPPHQAFVKMGEWGYYLDLPDDLYDTDPESHRKMNADFDEWLHTACPHPYMHLASERVDNIWGMAEFKNMLEKLGGIERFPILTLYLPTANSGTLPAEHAPAVWEELMDLETAPTVEFQVYLLEANTRTIVAATPADQPSIFLWARHNRFNYCLDKDGFFVMQNEQVGSETLPHLVFRSMAFKQLVFGEENYQLVDEATDQTFDTPHKLYPSGVEIPTATHEFVVELPAVRIKDKYAFPLRALKKLTQASIKSGNDIHWC